MLLLSLRMPKYSETKEYEVLNEKYYNGEISEEKYCEELYDNINPIIAPKDKDNTISKIGINKVFTIVNSAPVASTFAKAKQIEKIINPIASSKATTGNNVFVTTPLALYWRTTINVAAGAVAAAIAASEKATGNGALNAHKAKKTNPDVINAWNKVITIILFPNFLSQIIILYVKKITLT